MSRAENFFLCRFMQQALVIGCGKTQHVFIPKVLADPGTRCIAHLPAAFRVAQQLQDRLRYCGRVTGWDQ
jgi:hypothetical protein